MNVKAKYLIETSIDPEQAALILAGEQSTGTFVKIPGETEEIHERHAAKVISIEAIKSVKSPSLPYAEPSDTGVYTQAMVEVAYPIENFGYSLPNLITTLAGNLYELKEFSGMRLLDFSVPADFTNKYPVGKFGISGTRELIGVANRPMIGTIVKPSVGLPKGEFRLTVRTLAEAGLDFIKDDELTGNPLYLPFKDRVEIAMEEINRVADKTGKKTMYAFNITDDIDQMKRNHDVVVANGGNCVMVSINSIGYEATRYIANYSGVPIHGHRNQWGAMTRHPLLGMSFTAYQKLCRLSGVDHLHTNGLNSKFAESNESVTASIKDCLKPIYQDDQVLPVISSAQWAGSAEPTYQAVNTTDLLHLAGGGILAHPSGINAGVKSFIRSWEGVMNGESFAEIIKEDRYVREAYEKFG